MTVTYEIVEHFNDTGRRHLPIQHLVPRRRTR
jgi:hypothetical protein